MNKWGVLFLTICTFASWFYLVNSLDLKEDINLEQNGFHYTGTANVTSQEFITYLDEYGNLIGDRGVYILSRTDNIVEMAYSFDSLEIYPNLLSNGNPNRHIGYINFAIYFLLVIACSLATLTIFTFISKRKKKDIDRR